MIYLKIADLVFSLLHSTKQQALQRNMRSSSKPRSLRLEVSMLEDSIEPKVLDIAAFGSGSLASRK